MKSHKIDKPFILIIFGASGDLAQLKLFPALYSLMEQNKFPKKFYIIGYARSPLSQKQFKEQFQKSIEKAHPKANKALINQITKRVHYFQGQYSKIEDFKKFRLHLRKLTGREQITKLAYFSVPPQVFKPIIKNLGETKILKHEDLRLILEKPFGEDQESARQLFHFVARYFDEECVYLLDHYLGKSAVQSILHLRHSNRLLNLMMKGPEIANIQITASETVGVTSRVGYFNEVGTIKDMIQSHLLQLLALIAMSIPISEKAEDLQREKYSILQALKFIEYKHNIVLGQYESYKKEKEVPVTSNTETFAALRLFIDRESWYKTPIYIRTGKKLKEKHTYVVVEIKKFGFQTKSEEPNRIVFELQPDEKINIRLINKHSTTSKPQQITTSDSIACTGDNCLPEHSLLLLDVMRKNRMHFLSFQEIIATWRITDCILKFITRNKVKIQKYKDSSQGPQDQHKLTEIDGFQWFDLHQI